MGEISNQLWHNKLVKSKKPVSKRITTAQKKLDRLIQQYYVPKNPYCLVCGNPTDEMHHFIQKRQSTYLRYHKKNLIPLCKRCHYRHHTVGEPQIVLTIVRKKGKKWEDWITAHRNILVKRNLDYLEGLEERIRVLESGILTN